MATRNRTATTARSEAVAAEDVKAAVILDAQNEEPMSTLSPTATTAKLTVALPMEAIKQVEEIAARSQKTKTQVLREAIALKSFIEREMAQHDTHLMIERGGTTREVVFT